jgi:hypothetical protein
MENINCSMLKRKLNALTKHECVSGSNSGGSGSSNDKQISKLKIIVDLANEKVYTDRSPVSIYEEFAEMIQQKYYIRYAEGEFHVMVGEGMVKSPVLYIGTCTAGLYGVQSAFEPDGYGFLPYELEFSTREFIFGIGTTEGSGNDSKSVYFQIANTGDMQKVAQYNDETIGIPNYTYDLSFIWESV